METYQQYQQQVASYATKHLSIHHINFEDSNIDKLCRSGYKLGSYPYYVAHQIFEYHNGVVDDIATEEKPEQPVMDSELLLQHAKASLVGIERKLDLCNVSEHEKREIMQMVYAYASYCSQVDEAHKIADVN